MAVSLPAVVGRLKNGYFPLSRFLLLPHFFGGEMVDLPKVDVHG